MDTFMADLWRILKIPSTCNGIFHPEKWARYGLSNPQHANCYEKCCSSSLRISILQCKGVKSKVNPLFPQHLLHTNYTAESVQICSKIRGGKTLPHLNSTIVFNNNGVLLRDLDHLYLGLSSRVFPSLAMSSVSFRFYLQIILDAGTQHGS